MFQITPGVLARLCIDTHNKIMSSDSTSTYRDDYVRRDAFQQLEDATQVTPAKILDNCGSSQP